MVAVVGTHCPIARKRAGPRTNGSTPRPPLAQFNQPLRSLKQIPNLDETPPRTQPAESVRGQEDENKRFNFPYNVPNLVQLNLISNEL